MIIRKCIRDTVWKSFAFLILLQAHLVAVVIFFPDFEREADAIKRSLPGDFFKKILDSALSKGYDSYIAFQHFAKALGTFGTFAAVFLGNSAVAGEVEHKTAEFLLSRPFSRKRFLISRYLVGIVALVLPILLVTPTAIPLARIVDETATVYPLVLEVVHSSIFLIMIYSVTFFFSTIGRDSLRVAFGMLAICLAAFIMLIVKGISHYSFYKLADMGVLLNIIVNERYPWTENIAMGAVIAASFGASLYKFERRDF
ncbi:MAG: ABC transporter permease [Planctomycetota bacterium]